MCSVLRDAAHLPRAPAWWHRGCAAGALSGRPKEPAHHAYFLHSRLLLIPLQDHPEDFAYSEQMTWRKLGRLLLIKTNVLVILQARSGQGLLGCGFASVNLIKADPGAVLLLQGLFGCLPWGMILVFLNDFMSQDKGLTVQQATLVLLVLGIGGGVGVVGGGCLGQWLYNRQKWSMPAFIGKRPGPSAKWLCLGGQHKLPPPPHCWAEWT